MMFPMTKVNDNHYLLWVQNKRSEVYTNSNIVNHMWIPGVAPARLENWERLILGQAKDSNRLHDIRETIELLYPDMVGRLLIGMGWVTRKYSSPPGPVVWLKNDPTLAQIEAMVNSVER